MIKILKTIYAIPVLPIIIILAIKEYMNPFYKEGKVSEQLIRSGEKYKWIMRTLAFIGWILIISALKNI